MLAGWCVTTRHLALYASSLSIPSECANKPPNVCSWDATGNTRVTRCSWSPYHTGQDPLPNTPHHTPDLRNAWYYIHHVVLGKSVWKFWQPESKRPSTAAMFNTNHPEAVLRAYHTLTHICINRVSMPPNWLSPLRPHFYCLSLFPIGSCPLIQNV